MKDLLVSVTNKTSDEDLPSQSQKHDQLNTENVENVAEGSSIKVSISQDNLLTKSPHHQQSRQSGDMKPERGPTLDNITENSSTEKSSAKPEKKISSKSDRATERHRYPHAIFFHQKVV